MVTLKTYHKSAQYGGETGGDEFEDNLDEAARLMAVSIRYGDKIDSICCVWEKHDGTQFMGKRHGGSGGEKEGLFVLEKDEYISNLTVIYKLQVLGLIFATDKAHEYSYLGNESDAETGNIQGKVAGFFGRDGSVIDAIGVLIPN